MSSYLLPLVKRWIAGERAIDAIVRAREGNKRGMMGIINFLGEHTNEPKEVEKAVSTYLELLTMINKEGVKSCISVKPTQLGLLISRDAFHKSLTRIAEEAWSSKNFVWIDMESSLYTQNTIDTYSSLLASFSNMGICIQANLRRSEGDVYALVEEDGRIRLCKGAYREREEIAFKSRREISFNFSRLMGILFKEGKGFAIATHDGEVIEEAVRLNGAHKADFEFQMLQGIRDRLKLELVKKGYQVSEYIPYGREWVPYVIRRIRERKRNLLLILRSLISG